MKKVENSKLKYIRNIIVFFLILTLVLKTVSWLLVCAQNIRNPLENQSGSAILLEKKDSIDVVFMGDSNIQSSVCPAQLWQQFGMTSYVWGGACYHLYETEHNLRKVLRHQSPKIVFIETNPLQSCKPGAQSVNQKVKADVGSVFGLVLNNRFMKNLFPNRWDRWSIGRRSISKGYWFQSRRQAYVGGNWMVDTTDVADFPELEERSLKRCVEMCRQHGTIPILIAAVSPYEWNMACHNRTQQIANELQVDFWDLNLRTQEMGLDWSQDFSDGGLHMNYWGTQKNSNYIGQNLVDRYGVEDHRLDDSYAVWAQDCDAYIKCQENAIARGKIY